MFYKYRTDQGNTITAQSTVSFTGLTGNEAQLSSSFVIPSLQPLYLYRVTGGTTVVANQDSTVTSYLGNVVGIDNTPPVTLKTFTGYTASTTYYKYNAGSAPTVYTNNKFFVGQTTTDATGVATFYLTTNGLSGGTAIFNTIHAVEVVAQNNTSSIASIPLVALKNIASTKIVTVNVIDAVTIILGGLGLSFVGAGITVHLTARGI